MRATRCHTATCADISPRHGPTDKAETAAQGTQRRQPAAIMKAERTPTASVLVTRCGSARCKRPSFSF